jgi:hypothetical protein
VKKLLTTFLLLYSLAMFSQTYHLSYSVENKRMASSDVTEWNWGKTFFDVKNDAFMSFVDDGTLKGILFDNKKRMSHVFFITEGKDFTKFKYSHSNKYSEEKYAEENPYFIDIKKLDEKSFQVEVYIYTNRKKTEKKKKVSAVVSVKKSDFEYFVIREDFFPSEYIKTKILEMLPKESKYLIDQVVVEFVGSTPHTLINEVQPIDITLEVP